ncbi:MAG TPA: amidohydrolase [Longimicrobiales bacterium]
MTAAAPEHGRDLLVLADRIHTCDTTDAATALLIRDGRVVAVGAPDALRAAADRPRTLDLPGATITPGLTDAHAHLTEWAFARREVDLADARSPAAAAALVQRHAEGSAAGAWVRGRGWNPHRWDGAAPHRVLLDAIDRPAALQSHDMHALWVNGAALALAGIDRNTPDPEGGTIVRSPDGEPTGVLLEWASRLVTQHIAPPSLAAAAAAVRDAQAELHSLGITGIHSFPGIHLTKPDPLAVLRHLQERDELRLRIVQLIALDQLDAAITAGLRSGDGDDWIRIGAVKMFLDGALGSRTAWMREPYEDGSGCGIRTMDPAEFRACVQRAAAHGIACAVHAIGDAAVSLALDVLADPAVKVAAVPHRIEHLQCCPVERLADAAWAGIVCSMQPSHLMTDWSAADDHWGEQRARGTYAFGSLHRLGTILAFGSDVPVEPVDPRRGLFAAVTRQDLTGAPEGGWFPDERIDALGALHGFTTGPARAAGLHAPAGSLAPGAAADFAAWDRDPCENPETIMQARCVTTVVAGEVVHAC